MAMQEPRSSVIGSEANRDVISSSASTYDVASNWVSVVIFGRTGHSNHIKGVSVKVHGMLFIVSKQDKSSKQLTHREATWERKLNGAVPR